MSDLLSAAAAALGIPEALAQRSAEARSTETGASVDDILASWAGGAPPPVRESPRPTQSPEAPVAPEEMPQPAMAIEIPAPVAPAPVHAAGPYKPPVLIGVKDNPLLVLAGALGLFLLIALVGFVGPSSLADEPGNRSSSIHFTASALEGRAVYESQGCAACHTQMVRPLVADVGLGDVTLNDTNQILGHRRFGPDLSDVGSRLNPGQLEALVGGAGGHPGHTLPSNDLAALVDYLSQSSTGGTDE